MSFAHTKSSGPSAPKDPLSGKSLLLRGKSLKIETGDDKLKEALIRVVEIMGPFSRLDNICWIMSQRRLIIYLLNFLTSLMSKSTGTSFKDSVFYAEYKSFARRDGGSLRGGKYEFLVSDEAHQISTLCHYFIEAHQSHQKIEFNTMFKYVLQRQYAYYSSVIRAPVDESFQNPRYSDLILKDDTIDKEIRDVVEDKSYHKHFLNSPLTFEQAKYNVAYAICFISRGDSSSIHVLAVILAARFFGLVTPRANGVDLSSPEGSYALLVKHAYNLYLSCGQRCFEFTRPSIDDAVSDSGAGAGAGAGASAGGSSIPSTGHSVTYSSTVTSGGSTAWGPRR